MDFLKKNMLALLILLVAVALVIYYVVPKLIKKNNKVVNVDTVEDSVDNQETEAPVADMVESEPSSGGKAQCVFFHMNGCGHCEAMKPEWAKLSEMGSYKGCEFVDFESENVELMKLHKIQGFPTIKYCPNGVKDINGCVTHEGERTADAIKAFVDQNHK